MIQKEETVLSKTKSRGEIQSMSKDKNRNLVFIQSFNIYFLKTV